MRNAFFSAVSAAAMMTCSTAWADNNMLLILDASNSMWGQTDGVAKIETARDALNDVIGGLPASSKVGIMAYGHTSKDSCTDVAMLSPLQAPDAAAIKKQIAGIQPKGKTPIAYALEQAGLELVKQEGDTNSLVLISDGIETCEGDPCATAASLAKANVNTKIHVVGFNVDAQARKQLECIADKGNGQYYNADNADGLKMAMAEVKKVVEEKPKEPELSVIFEDNFDGAELAEHWEIVNPNPDAFIVENGTLQILANGGLKQSLAEQTVPNLFKLTESLPEGDWTATMRVLVDVQTVRERYIMGLMRDNENMLYGEIGPASKCCYHPTLKYRAAKLASGKLTDFSKIIQGPRTDSRGGKDKADWLNKNIDAVQLRYTKKGREYTISALLEGPINGDEEPTWQTLQELTSLRIPGNQLFITASQNNKVETATISGGETLVSIDWVKIEAAVPETSEGEPQAAN